MTEVLTKALTKEAAEALTADTDTLTQEEKDAYCISLSQWSSQYEAVHLPVLLVPFGFSYADTLKDPVTGRTDLLAVMILSDILFSFAEVRRQNSEGLTYRAPRFEGDYLFLSFEKWATRYGATLADAEASYRRLEDANLVLTRPVKVAQNGEIVSRLAVQIAFKTIARMI